MTDTVYVAHYNGHQGTDELIGVYSSFELALEALNVLWSAKAAFGSRADTIQQWGWQSAGPYIWTAWFFSRHFCIELLTLDAPLGP